MWTRLPGDPGVPSLSEEGPWPHRPLLGPRGTEAPTQTLPHSTSESRGRSTELGCIVPSSWPLSPAPGRDVDGFRGWEVGEHESAVIVQHLFGIPNECFVLFSFHPLLSTKISWQNEVLKSQE